MYIVEVEEPESEVEEEEALDEVVAAVLVELAVEEEEAEGFPALEILCEFEVVGAEVAVGGCLVVVGKRVLWVGCVAAFLNGTVVVTVINRVVEVNAPPLEVNMGGYLACEGGCGCKGPSCGCCCTYRCSGCWGSGGCCASGGSGG